MDFVQFWGDDFYNGGIVGCVCGFMVNVCDNLVIFVFIENV